MKNIWQIYPFAWEKILEKKMKKCEEEVLISVKEKNNLAEDNRILLRTIESMNILIRDDRAKEQRNLELSAEAVANSVPHNNIYVYVQSQLPARYHLIGMTQ